MAQPGTQATLSDALDSANMPLYVVIGALLVVIMVQAAQNWMLSQAAERNINPDVVKDFIGFTLDQTRKVVDDNRAAIKASKNPFDDIGLGLFDMLTRSDELDEGEEKTTTPPAAATVQKKEGQDALAMVKQILAENTDPKQTSVIDKDDVKKEAAKPRRK